jgi:hypothetical protein
MTLGNQQAKVVIGSLRQFVDLQNIAVFPTANPGPNSHDIETCLLHEFADNVLHSRGSRLRNRPIRQECDRYKGKYQQQPGGQEVCNPLHV